MFFKPDSPVAQGRMTQSASGEVNHMRAIRPAQAALVPALANRYIAAQ
jgi:hypothetical protein